MRIDSFLLGVAGVVTALGIGAALFVLCTMETGSGEITFSFSTRSLSLAALLLVVSGVPCCLGIGCVLCVWVGLFEKRLNLFGNIRCDMDAAGKMV